MVVSGCSPSPEEPGDSAPPGDPAPTPSAAPVLTEDAARSMEYLGTCGWEFPAPVVTMKEGKQATKSHSWQSVNSTAEITAVTELSLGDRALLRVSFECAIGRDVWFGEHLVGEVDGKPVDLGLIGMADTTMSIKPTDDELAVSYRYQRVGEANAARSGTSSYRVALVGNTPVRLFGDQSTDDVDPSLETLPPRAWSAGLVSMYAWDYDPNNGAWLPGVLTAPDTVITPAQLGAYQSSCLQPTTYTQSNEELEHAALQLTGPSRTKLEGTTVSLAKDSDAPPGRVSSGFAPSEERLGLLVDLNGRVPGVATVKTTKAEMAPEETVVVSPGVDDETMINSRADTGPEPRPGSLGVLLDWDATVLMMGIWNDEQLGEGEIVEQGMLPMPDPQEAQEAVCERQ